MYSASSLLNHYYGPWSAKLQDRNHGYYRGGWYPKYNRRGEWLQVDLGTLARVSKVCFYTSLYGCSSANVDYRSLDREGLWEAAL